MPLSNPVTVFRFEVEFLGAALNLIAPLGYIKMSFQKVTGLKQTLGVEKLRVGGENRFEIPLPNPSTFETLKLEKAFNPDDSLLHWVRMATELFVFLPVDISVKMMGPDYKTPLSAWYFQKAWPVSFSLTDLNASENGLVIQTLELAYQGFKRIK